MDFPEQHRQESKRSTERRTLLIAAILGVVAALLVGFVWGSARQLPVVHDEAAYLLQAELFSTGRWKAPGFTLPEFFEQYHVLVTPVVAAKYPPGHSLAITPGVWLGLPGLMPLIFTALAAALVFFLAARVIGPVPAALTWLLWFFIPDNLRNRASYFSETTTSVLVLFVWLALLEWGRTGRSRWLYGLSTALAWSAITRPLTALALGIPVLIVVLIQVTRTRAWGALMGAGIAGIAVVSLLPLWTHSTTGDLSNTPLELYTRMYIPWDEFGFGYNRTPPIRPLPPDMIRFSEDFRPVYEQHANQPIFRLAIERAVRLTTAAFESWRVLLLPLLLVGLAYHGKTRPKETLFLAGSVSLLFLGYLAYAFGNARVLYYLEILPLGPYYAVVGLTAALAFLRQHYLSVPNDATIWSIALSLALVAGLIGLVRTRESVQNRVAYFQSFHSELARIPEARAGVIVRYSATHNPHNSLINNEPDLARARLVIARDRNDDNHRLVNTYADRTWYIYDEATKRLTRLRSGAQ